MSDKKQHSPPQSLENHRRPRDHILNIIKAALSTAPFGVGIASLMIDYIPSMKEKRLEKFVREIAADLKSLQDRIDEDLIQTDEFAFVLESCLRGAAEHY